MVTRPQAPPRGQLGRDDELLIASMHLSMRKYKLDISWLMEEVDLLMRQAHIVVLTGISAFWMKVLRDKLKTLATSQGRGNWDFRFDDEAVCVLWPVETCSILEARVYLVFPGSDERKNYWRKALKCLFEVGPCV